MTCNSELKETQDSSEQTRFVWFWWACANCSLGVLFIPDRSDTWYGLALMWPINVWHVMHSSYLAYKEWLNESTAVFLSSQSSLAFSPPTYSNYQGLSPTELMLTGHLFLTILCKNQEWLSGSPSWLSASEMLKTTCLASTTLPGSKALWYLSSSF